jgi:sucrose-6F-phosphate phosphohydrolase
MTSMKLLASDMDGTLIPLSEHQDYRRDIEEFNSEVAAGRNLHLAYITGRHLELGLAGVEQHHLPMPDIFICDVGTSVYFLKEGQWQLDENYRQKLKQSWQGADGSSIIKLLSAIPQLSPQEDEKQGEFKSSFYLPAEAKASEVRDHIRALFRIKNIQANLIFSLDSLKETGLLDILPPMAAKDAALHHLAGHFSIARQNVFYAGDSGNDLLAFVSGYQAIVVGNTDKQTKEAVQRIAIDKKLQDRIFFAQGFYTAGVLEGCRHFQVFADP